MRRFACLLPFAFLLLTVACTTVGEDDAEGFDAWLRTNSVQEFEQYLAAARLDGVIPTRQLLLTATDWRRCQGPRFELPPRELWPHVTGVLSLIAELKRRGILRQVQAVSGYRNPELNACARGAPASAHTRSFALDIGAAPGQIDTEALCEFWRTQGEGWAMGLSRYPSGRIHLDTSGWRSWGADHTRATAFCAIP